MAETTTPTPAPATPAPAAPVAPVAPVAPANPAAPTSQVAAPATGKDAGSVTVPVKGAEENKGGTGLGGTGGGQQYMFFILIGVMVLMFWWMSRSQKKREKQRLDMLKRLKVGERVMTGGGIIGEIVEMTDDEVTLRIDPRKDVRMRLKRGVIVGPAGEASSDQALKEQQPQQ